VGLFGDKPEPVPYVAPPPPDRAGRWPVRPGDVVWTAVPFMDQPGVAKDRPVLIVGREPGIFLVLTLTTQGKRHGHPEWYPLGTGPWDRQGRPSWARLHPWYRMRETDVRRPGGPVDRAVFDGLRGVLARQYGWTFPNG
jgi:hypothetical protein